MRNGQMTDGTAAKAPAIRADRNKRPETPMAPKMNDGKWKREKIKIITMEYRLR